jgi:DNA-binding MarR family transcriptional regulator
MKPEHLLFRINGIVRAVERTVGLGKLDPVQKALLAFIGEAEAERKSVKVTDIVKTSAYGSAPTVYARMNDLELDGWIEYVPDPYDRRARQVVLSDASRQAYRKIAREVKRCFEQD